jgi:hypothetical protein
MDIQQGPKVRVFVPSVLDDFKMQVASSGRPCGAHFGNNLPNPDLAAFLGTQLQQVVISRDQAIAVVDLQPVAASPRVPARGTDDAGVGSIDSGSAGCSEILPIMKFAQFPGDWIFT